MAIVNGYGTRTQLEKLLKGAEFSGTGHDDDTDRAIETASRWIDRETGRRFYEDSTVQTRYYTPTDWRHLEVDDISTDTGLLVTTDSQLDNTFETSWTVDDYSGSFGFRLQPENEGAPWNRLEALSGSWPLLRRAVKIVAKFGYAAVPTEVEHACLMLAVRLYKRKDSPFGVLEFPAAAAVTQLPRMDPDVANTIGHLRRFARVDSA